MNKNEVMTWIAQMPDFGAAAQRAVLDNLPIDPKLVCKARKAMENERLRRLVLLSVCAGTAVTVAGIAGQRMLYRSAVAREVKRQLVGVNEKLDELHAQNAELLRQNEALMAQLIPAEEPAAEAPAEEPAAQAPQAE